MADLNDLTLVLVLVVVVEGIWLAGLTYMMWKRHLARKKAKTSDRPQKEND